MLRRCRNLIRSNWGWSFRGTDFSTSRKVLYAGERLWLRSHVHNEGLRLGTAYVRFLVADPYCPDTPVFDSDRDLSPNEKQSLRLIDLAPNRSREAACSFPIPDGLAGRPFDIRLQVWNPHRLFDGPHPWLFYDSGWTGGFEVVARPPSDSPLSVFVSYSWDPPTHKDWVRQLVEELRKHDLDVMVDWKDLRPGESIPLFMERGIVECKVVLLICNDQYTAKADGRIAGVGFETMLSAHEYYIRSPDERDRMIAVVRDNTIKPSGRKLPRYLAGSAYIDMSGADWQGAPILKLVDAIRKHG